MTPTRLLPAVAISVLAAGLPFIAAAQAPAPAAPSPAASQAAVPPADEILDRYREAIGGEAAVRKHTARSVKGTFEIPAQGIKGDLALFAAAPNLIRVIVTLPGLGELQRGCGGVQTLLGP